MAVVIHQQKQIKCLFSWLNHHFPLPGHEPSAKIHASAGASATVGVFRLDPSHWNCQVTLVVQVLRKRGFNMIQQRISWFGGTPLTKLHGNQQCCFYQSGVFYQWNIGDSTHNHRRVWPTEVSVLAAQEWLDSEISTSKEGFFVLRKKRFIKNSRLKWRRDVPRTTCACGCDTDSFCSTAESHIVHYIPQKKQNWSSNVLIIVHYDHIQ